MKLCAASRYVPVQPRTRPITSGHLIVVIFSTVVFLLFSSLLLSRLCFIKPASMSANKTGEESTIYPRQYLTKNDFTVKKAVLLESTGGTVMLGVGYSDDMQQVTEQPCFNVTIASISERQGDMSLDEALTFSELQNKMEMDFSVGGGWWIFSAYEKAVYMKSLEDKDYSISLNYYNSVSEKVTVKIGDGPLTESGKHLYNNSNNRYFGLVCGDNYIASYKQGAFLSMGLNIELNSHEEKKIFTEKAKINIGPFNLPLAAGSIQNLSTQNNISGSITLHAFQIGGKPSQLANIRINNILKCSITSMDECVKTAEKLLDYAKNFGNQIQNSTGLEPLTYTHHPIKWIGLTPADTLVTPEIVQSRNYLLNKLKENQYYKQKFYSLSKGYPVKLDNSFLKNLNYELAKVNDNIGVLSDPQTGAVGCYNLPDQCQEIKVQIDSKLQSITTDHLNFLEDVKFCLLVDQGVFYSNGNKTASSWSFKPVDGSITIETVNISDEHCMYNFKKEEKSFIYNGTWNSSLGEYIGSYCIEKSCNDDATIKKVLSPFYFEKYNSSSE